MVDLTLEVTKVGDESRYARDGSIIPEIRVTFFLGRFGPFIERFDKATFSDSAVRTRADALALTLRNLHP